MGKGERKMHEPKVKVTGHTFEKQGGLLGQGAGTVA